MSKGSARRTVVVTGGAGFIGANLCRHLTGLDDVAKVVVVDDFSTGSLQHLDGVDVVMHEGTILDPQLLDEACDGASTVVHLAARGSVPRSLLDPGATHAVNVTGTIEVLEAARRQGVGHLVFASSSSVYGASAQLPKRESAASRPMSPYAASKLAAEGYVLAYQHAFGLPTLAFRFFNVFGPLQGAGHAYAAVIPAFIHAALRGYPLLIHGDGRQTRDFTFVDTVVSVLGDAVVRDVSHPTPVNLALGSRVTLLDIVELLSAELGRELPREHGEPRLGDVRDSQADSTTLRALFPDVRTTDLQVALAETIAWLRTVSVSEAGGAHGGG